MSGNEVKLTLAGDAKGLKQATQEGDDAVGKLDKGFGKTVAGAVTFAQGLADLGDSVLGVTELMKDQAGKADRLAREQADVAQAALDVEQAMRDGAQALLDYDQAQRDVAQAGIDLEQALLDQKKAQQDYAAAVKEYGKNSVEAKQAQLDMKQAAEDVKQAQLDQKQAQEDANQAMLDGKQAAVDATQAQLDMNDAQREAGQSGFARSVEEIGKYLNVLMPIVMLATGAQWAFNASLLASPITWIVLGIAAIIAIIVLLIVYWDDVKKYAEIAWNWIWDKLKAFGLWVWDHFWTNGWKKVIDLLVGAWKTTQTNIGKVWDWIKDKAGDAVEWFKSLPTTFKNIFLKVADFITAPFRAAFNFIADAWNNTIGSLSWTVPDWVPLIGGANIHAPRLPHFHQGGMVGGGPEGSEVLAVLRVGERVQTREMQHAEAQGIRNYYITVNGDRFRDGTDFQDWLDGLRNDDRTGDEVYA